MSNVPSPAPEGKCATCGAPPGIFALYQQLVTRIEIRDLEIRLRKAQLAAVLAENPGAAAATSAWRHVAEDCDAAARHLSFDRVTAIGRFLRLLLLVPESDVAEVLRLSNIILDEFRFPTGRR
jgi:hypothetical protein